MAWLGTSTVTAVSRLGTARGWVRTDGKPFADTAAEVGKLAIDYPPYLDESGNALAAGEIAYTGLDGNGNLYMSGGDSGACSDWTLGTSSATILGSTGTVHYGSGWWTYSGQQTCDKVAHLYCLQTDHTVAVTPPARPRAPGSPS